MKTGYIFDLDGTLLNTLEDIADSMNLALEENGLPTKSIDEIRTYIGDGAKKFAQRASGNTGEIAKKTLVSYQSYYEKQKTSKTAPYKGIEEMLEKLKKLGHKMAVLSNKPHKDTVEVVKHFFPEDIFEIVSGQKEYVPVKPDPEGAFLIAKKLQLDPKQIIFVGDSKADMLCARNAEMYAVGVGWGFRDKEELKKHGAQICIDEPMDILKINIKDTL